MRQLRHFSHEEHPLFLKIVVKNVVSCHGCAQEISSESAYCCEQCRYFLHKSCAERPLQITHPMHPQHPLRLYAKIPYSIVGLVCSCNCCWRSCTGFIYHCSSCEFDIDIVCAFLDRSKNYKHVSHDHALKFQARPALFKCDACGVRGDDSSYQCTECPFWIHRTCAFLPSTLQHSHHDHPLSLVNCLPEEYRAFKFFCDVCREKLHPVQWVYHCRSCRYVVHLRCMSAYGSQAIEARNSIQEIRSNHQSPQGFGSSNSGQHQQQSATDSNAVIDELEKALSKIIGLEDLKQQLRTWAKGLIMDFRRQKLGINTGPRKPPHMAFLGNPGTGKTTVARILGNLLHNLGVLSSNKVVEVQRTDLVAEYIGQTGPKTKAKIDEAEGGILFVDEAYRLVVTTAPGCSTDLGIEALEEIMSVMESGKLSVIFAGYKEPMQRLLASNEGFRRRVNTCFIFGNYSCEELAKIFHLEMSRKLSGFKLDRLCSIDVVASLIEMETLEEHRNKMNGGLVEQMLTKARENLDRRLEVDCVDENTLVTITLQDLEAALQLVNKNQENAFEDNGH